MAQVGWTRFVRSGLAVTAAGSLLLLSAACGGSSSSSSSDKFNVSKDSSVAALVPKSIQDAGQLTVATDPSYAPNEFVNTSTQAIEGMDVDLGHALGDVMGVKWNFVKSSFDAIIPGLTSGKYQIGMSSFTDTAERQKTVDFVTYFSAGTSFYTSASGGFPVAGLQSLCGVTVGVERGTTQQADATAQSKTCVSKGQSPVKVMAYPDQNGANVALSSGRVKVVMADSPVAAYAVKQSDGKFTLAEAATYGTAPYGIAISRPQGVQPGKAPMTAAVEAAMKQLIKDGTYIDILKKWGVEQGAITKPVVNGAIS